MVEHVGIEPTSITMRVGFKLCQHPLMPPLFILMLINESIPMLGKAPCSALLFIHSTNMVTYWSPYRLLNFCGVGAIEYMFTKWTPRLSSFDTGNPRFCIRSCIACSIV